MLLSSALPGERLRTGHVIGAGLGFAGAALILSGGGAFAFDDAHAFGFGAALACALLWSSYSVLSRVMGEAPTESVTGFCFAAGALSLVCHLALEQTVWPATALEWASVLCLGLGPVGLAFYVWDIGVKRGDIQLLGVSSYAAPLLSTLALIGVGYAEATKTILAAAGLIVAGSLIAAMASLKAASPQRQAPLKHEAPESSPDPSAE